MRSLHMGAAFDVSVTCGSHWLTWLKSRQMTPAMRSFRDWMAIEAASP